LFVEEAGTNEMLAIWSQADEVYCVSLGYLEVRSAIRRRLVGRDLGRAQRRLSDYWSSVEVRAVEQRLLRLGERAVDRHGLRTFDALHLAAALELRLRGLVLATWDSELRAAARAEGLATAP
jgi:predicted nucleic acid-binding protein